jgi:hypothetical protein
MSKPDLSAFRFPQKRPLELRKLPTKVKDLYEDETDYLEKLGSLRDDINEMQVQMFAHNRHSMLVVFQAMDAAGKDSTIEHVFSGINPEGVQVTSFKRLWFNNVERVAAEKIGRETVQYVSNIYKYYIAYRLIHEQEQERTAAKKAIAAEDKAGP